jgi:hypothetical protein
MEQWEFKSYSEYVKAQIERNRRNLGNSWVTKDALAYIADVIRSHLGVVRKGLCHGTQRGIEQAYFREALNADVIGTEISPTACQFSNTIQWDFHEKKSEWEGTMDFIYSNALDHAADPDLALTSWLSCLSKEGLLVLHWEQDSHDKVSNASDPFRASLGEYVDLIRQHGHLVSCCYFPCTNRKRSHRQQYLLLAKKVNDDRDE